MIIGKSAKMFMPGEDFIHSEEIPTLFINEDSLEKLKCIKMLNMLQRWTKKIYFDPPYCGPVRVISSQYCISKVSDFPQCKIIIWILIQCLYRLICNKL